MKQLDAFALQVGAPLLVLHDAASASLLAPHDPDWEVHPFDGSLPERQRWAGVAVVVADRGTLRSAVRTLPRLGRTRAVACVLTDEDDPAHVAPRPDWPPITRLVARRLEAGGAMTVLKLQRSVSANAVLRELARLAGTAPPASERILLESPTRSRRFTLPPEIVVVADSSLTVHDYAADVAPAPVIVTDPVLACGPLDEGVINPIGFHSEPDQGVAVLDADLAVSARTVASLRSHQAVRVDWAVPTPELARTVAALAMAGIPLVGGPPPTEARPWLGDGLFAALSVDAEVTDPLRREEHSIRARRAALFTHSGPGWRSRVTEAAGRTGRRFPSCSVVLATRRPDQLDFAVRNVARQHGVDVELVVAAHGFEPDTGRVRAQHPGGPVEVVSVPQETVFGDVLNAGVAASSGQIVVKMDDDDFYGPDFLVDLLLAREYSGADVVGTPAEFVYLEGPDLTIRRHGTRRDASELFADPVAGGTLTITRGLLDDIGGFQPVHRFEDHQLFYAAQALGASIYRSHGLGFMLRRSAGGHTWPVENEHFLDPTRLHQQWPGFSPTRILEPDQPEPT